MIVGEVSDATLHRDGNAKSRVRRSGCVFHTTHLQVMCCKERESFRLQQESLSNGPCERCSIPVGGSTSELIDKDQSRIAEVVQDVCGLPHLAGKGRAIGLNRVRRACGLKKRVRGMVGGAHMESVR